jgi:hypothetical protein
LGQSAQSSALFVGEDSGGACFGLHRPAAVDLAVIEGPKMGKNSYHGSTIAHLVVEH